MSHSLIFFFIALHFLFFSSCHVMCQFYVANGELSCQMYQVRLKSAQRSQGSLRSS